MFKIHLGDTPNNLTDADFEELGELSEGCASVWKHGCPAWHALTAVWLLAHRFSGSDIGVAVREALMEPLRICRTAKFFRKNSAGQYAPVPEDPPCPRCQPDLSSRPAQRGVPCQYCGAERLSLYELESDQLAVPDVTAVRHAASGAFIAWARLTGLRVWCRMISGVCWSTRRRLLPPRSWSSS